MSERQAPYIIPVTSMPVHDELATFPGWLRALCVAAMNIRAQNRRAMIIVKVNEDDSYTVFKAEPTQKIGCRQQAEKVI